MRRFLSILPFLVHMNTATDGTGEGQGGGGGAPPPAGTGQQAPPAGAAPPAGGDGKGSGQFEPGWLNERIAQAKRAAEADLLKRLGTTDPEAAAKAIAKAKELEDAQKSELQRKDEELKAATQAATQAKTYQDALTRRVQADLAQLPEAAQEKVKALAGDDPIKLMDAIDLVRAVGATAPAGQQAPAGAPQQRPPVPPAANTTNAAGGPPSAPGSATDHLAVWRDMQGKNPMAAAHYFLAHQADIVAAQQKQTSNQ